MRELVKTYPKLFKKTSTGAIQEWSICVVMMNNIATIVANYGQVNGKIQESTEQVLEGKNVTGEIAESIGIDDYNNEVYTPINTVLLRVKNRSLVTSGISI